MSTINFLEYLNRRRHGVLTEAVATVDLDITRGLAVKQFLEERVQDVDATVIKIAVFTGKGDFPTIYETDNQIGVEHGYIRVIGLPDAKDNRECKVAALLQDIDAFIEHEGEDKFDIPVKIGIGQNGG